MGRDRPTLDTVAKAAGVSRMTVSNAYNRPDQLSAATRERVLAVAAELGYPGPDPAGRSLRRGRTGTIGIVLAESLSYAFTDPGLVTFLRGMADVLSPEGRAMLLVPTGVSAPAEVIREAMVDAFVVFAAGAEDPAVAAIDRRGVPYLIVGSPRPAGRPCLSVANEAAAALAAEHLIGLGHRRLGVIGLPELVPAGEGGPAVPVRRGFRRRVQGFVAGAERFGIDASGVTVVAAERNSIDAGRDAATRLLSAECPPTAVFAVTDALALGVLVAVSEAGLAVPDDISVVGFDGIDEGRHSRPPLTTIDQDLRGQGRLAARLVLGLLAGGDPATPLVTPTLVVRASTGPPPASRPPT